MSARNLVTRIVWVWIIVALIVLTLGKVTLAQSKAGQTSAEFLKVGFGARAAGMGDAFGAVASGANASYWNPAGLMSSEDHQLTVSHFSWYQKISIEQAAASFNVNDQLAVGGHLTFVNYGTVNGYDNNGEFTNELSLSDFTVGLSVGYSVNDDISVGVTGKYISESVEDYKGTAMAADFGIIYNQPKFSIGLFAGNFGSKMKFESEEEKLPALGRLSLAFRPFANYLLSSTDVEKQVDGNLILKQGFEFSYNDRYFLRSGINYYSDQSERTFGSSLTLGGGVNLNNFNIDYSFTPTDQYTSESIHRFSMSLAFGN